MPTWISGTEIAQQIQAEVAAEAQRLAQAGIRPGLAVSWSGTIPPRTSMSVRRSGRVKRSACIRRKWRWRPPPPQTRCWPWCGV